MAEINVSQITYLSGAGLQTLWGKISSTFLRKKEVAAAIAADDTIKGLSGRIKEIEDSQGANIDIDNNTIIKDSDGKLQTNLILFNDEKNRFLRIVTNENDAERTTVTYWDYSQFYKDAVKDGILESVSLVVVPSEGNPEAADRPAGTYLKFVFNTGPDENPIKEPIYVNVTDLVEVYKGDKYISVTTSTDEEPAKISLDTAELVAYLNKDEALGITSLISRVEAVESKTADIPELKKSVKELQDALEGLNIDSLQALQEQVTSNTNTLTTIVNGLPYTAISDDEINDLA